MVYFQTKNPDLGKFWWVWWEWKRLVYSMTISSILGQFGTFYGQFGILSHILVFCVKKNLATLF
jgi:hypothetical protein